jgi:ribonuclease P protein component
MTTPVGEGFPKAARVRRRREYLALGRTARRRHAPHFVVLSEAHASGARLGMTVSRKVGGAVVRNHLKRRVRELFRRDLQRLLPLHDVVVIAKPGAGELGFHEIAHELATVVTSHAGPSRRI